MGPNHYSATVFLLIHAYGLSVTLVLGQGCSDLPSLIPNGGPILYSSGTGGSRPINTTATYSCTTSGYYFAHNSGNVVRICSGNGNWSGSPPSCGMPCPVFTVTNGRVEYIDSFGHLVYESPPGFPMTRPTNVRANIDCPTGYTISSPTRICQSNGTWNSSETTCHQIICPDLPLPTNGGVTYRAVNGPGTTRSVGTEATYSCNKTDGHFFAFESGNAVRTCQITGQWNGSAPSCGMPCPVFTVTNGTVTFSVSEESPEFIGMRPTNVLAYISCDTGVGNSTRTCQSDGTWSGREATCQETHCHDLDPPINGMIIYNDGSTNDRPVGTVATYSCNTSYILNGGSTRTCQLVGTWNGSDLICQGISVVVTPSGPPMAGQSFSLTCSVTGADSLSPIISYQWFRGQSLVTSSSVLSFDTLFLSNASQYRCEATVMGNVIVNRNFCIQFQALNIQLCFQVGNCSAYKQMYPESKTNEITDALVMAVDQLCRCGFNSSLISKSFIRCLDNSPQYVTYRAVLTRTPSINVSAVEHSFNQWIEMNGTIVVQSNILRVNGTCPLVIVDPDSPECPESFIRQTTPMYASPMNPTSLANSTSLAVTTDNLESIGVAIGGVFGGLAGPVTIIVIISLVIVIYRKYRSRSKPRPKQLKTKAIKEPIKMAVVSDVTAAPPIDPVNEYETLGQYQEETYEEIDKPRPQSGNPEESAVVPDSTNEYYESLDKYNDAESYEPMDRPHPPTRNYELKSCAAYGPPPASIYDNTDEFV